VRDGVHEIISAVAETLDMVKPVAGPGRTPSGDVVTSMMDETLVPNCPILKD
jgi:hypothetical protein